MQHLTPGQPSAVEFVEDPPPPEASSGGLVKGILMLAIVLLVSAVSTLSQSFAVRSSPSARTTSAGQPGFCSNEPIARTRKRGASLRVVVEPIGSDPVPSSRSNQSSVRRPLVA